MTGSERLQLVREALEPSLVIGPAQRFVALRALDGCVLLSAEEAESARMFLSTGKDGTHSYREVVDLLTPDSP